MKMTYDNALAFITSARAALSRDGFEKLMLETDRNPSMDQVCQAIEREQLTERSVFGAPSQ